MASYPRQIPAGGEGKIVINVHTTGYGGSTVKKNIAVSTNDPKKRLTNLSITGKVNNFVIINPKYARLNGTLDEDIKTDVTIQEEEQYPFTILKVSAKDGQNIKFNLTETTLANRKGYVLSIENLMKKEGRYADTIYLTTDSSIRPTLTIGVYGYIKASPQEKPKG